MVFSVGVYVVDKLVIVVIFVLYVEILEYIKLVLVKEGIEL